MILDFKDSNSSPKISDLIEEGLLIGAYQDGRGWFHEGLVTLLRNHNIPAYRQEYKSANFNLETKEIIPSPDSPMQREGIRKIHDELNKNRPVIVSVEKDFSDTSETHLVLLNGFAEDEVGLEGFFYLDPHVTDSKEKFVELDKFKKLWRNLAIFTE